MSSLALSNAKFLHSRAHLPMIPSTFVVTLVYNKEFAIFKIYLPKQKQKPFSFLLAPAIGHSVQTYISLGKINVVLHWLT